MRGLRSFAVLLLIALGLGAYLYFVESKRTPGDDEEQKDKVFTVDADAIEEITVRGESGSTTTLRRTGTDWQIVSPVTAPADAAEASGLATNLSSLEIQRVIEEQASDLQQFGLAAPRVEVSFKAGGQSHRLSIGGKTPPGSDVYARMDDQPRVFLIPSHLETTFNKGTFDLRDKAALRVQADAVDAVEITAGAQRTQLARTDGEWRLMQPLAAPADYTAVNSLVSRLASAQMKTVEDAPKPDLKSYGLDAPAATISVGTGSSRATLLVGAPAADGAVFAKDQSRPDVFTIEAALLDELKKPAAEYRQKDLFDARAFNTTRIEVTRAGRTTAFEKTRTKGADGKEEDKWRQVAPEAKDADGAKVDALILAATSARAESFAADGATTGLQTPELTLVVKFDEGKREDRVSFARAGADVFAARAGMPGAARIDAATLDAIVKALQELE